MENLTVNILNWDREVISERTVSSAIFACPINIHLLHQVTDWQRAKKRSGTHKVKARAEVAGSTRKIYKQKGSGRARHGSKKAPIFVGGGIVFGPVVRSHAFKLNKKVVVLGLKTALSLHYQQQSLSIMNTVELDNHKTSFLVQKLNNTAKEKILIIDVNKQQNILKACANLYHVNYLPVEGINVLDLLKHDKVLISSAAVDVLELRLNKTISQ